MGRATRQLLLSSLLALMTLPAALSCKREERSFRVAPPFVEMPEAVPYNNYVRPGPFATTTPSISQPVSIERLSHEPFGRQYLINAQALSDGQMLYGAFNCSGCHANGGGGMGPPLLDNKWFYGAEPEQVYVSILEGRPNGMPSYRGRIPDYQMWELVAYVLSLSGQASPNAAAGRSEHMTTALPPNSTPREKPEVAPQPTTGPATGRTATQPATTSQPRQNVQ
jgi:cytochrome c oxidase cbb3-type subunit 3